jgi:hypothetical protein
MLGLYPGRSGAAEGGHLLIYTNMIDKLAMVVAGR